MEKRKSRLFAVLLMAVFMMTSVFSAPANVYAAEETKKVNIETESKTENSITLKVEKGYEYAIQIVKEDKPDWKWAEASQYIEDQNTHEIVKVTFSELEANREYVFGKRAKGNTEGEVLTEIIKTEVEKTETSVPKTTESTTEATTKATEPATESTEPAIESTESATKSTEPATESTEPATESSTESTKASSESKDEVKTTEETEPALNGEKPTKAPAKNQPSAQDVAPPAGSKESESKESESKESESKKETEAALLETAAAAPVKPEVESRTDTEVRLKVVEGQEYALLSDGKAGTWNDTGVFSDLKPDTEYSFVTRMKYDPSKAQESVMSEAAAVHTKGAAAAAPAAPGIAKRTETSISLAPLENGEYGISETGENFAWQGSPEFTGLKAGTEYQFKTRIKYDSETAMESIASDSIMYQTLVPFEGSTVTGVAIDGSYVSGTKLTAAAVGNGMDNVNPVEGDSRWVPRTWNWGQKAFNSWKDNYTIPFTLVEVGNYRLSVDFEREDYTGGAWKASGEVKTYTIPFKVTAAPVTQYTITATSNGNGTINPQGNITAEQGKDYTFTFTPNNGYKVSKGYVDGYEVKAENNKYTFKAINANHTISVTFEQARKIDSPKTGDNMKTTPAIVLLVVSAALLLGVFVYGRKKNK